MKEAHRINDREKHRLQAIAAKLRGYPELKDYALTVSDGNVRMLNDRIYQIGTHGPVLRLQFVKMKTVSPIWEEHHFSDGVPSGFYNEDGTYSSTSDDEILRIVGEKVGDLQKKVSERKITNRPTNIFNIFPISQWVFIGLAIILLLLLLS